MLKMILSLFKGWRMWASLAGIVALSGLAWTAYNHVYASGYHAAQVKYQAEKLRAVQDALANARSKWEVSQKAAIAQIRTEQQIEERSRAIEKEVPKIVERVVPAKCHDLGPDIERLFNDAIRAGNSDEGSDPAVAAGSDS